MAYAAVIDVAAALALVGSGLAPASATAQQSAAKVGPAAPRDTWIVGRWCSNFGGATIYRADGRSQAVDDDGRYLSGGYRWRLDNDVMTEIAPDGLASSRTIKRVGKDRYSFSIGPDKYESVRC